MWNRPIVVSLCDTVSIRPFGKRRTCSGLRKLFVPDLGIALTEESLPTFSARLSLGPRRLEWKPGARGGSRGSGKGFVGVGLVRFNNSRITRFVICLGKPAILETTEKPSICEPVKRLDEDIRSSATGRSQEGRPHAKRSRRTVEASGR